VEKNPSGVIHVVRTYKKKKYIISIASEAFELFGLFFIYKIIRNMPMIKKNCVFPTQIKYNQPNLFSR